MFTLIQLLDTLPLPMVLLFIICATAIILAALVLCALFPQMGTAIADIVDAWRAPRRPRRRQAHRRRSRNRANRGK